MAAEICGALYHRPVEMGGDTVPCTYILNHPGLGHSWSTLAVQDASDMEDRTHRVHTLEEVPDIRDVGSLPENVQKIVSNLADGTFDEYLEIILDFAHARKRAKRGEKGYRRR